MRGWGASCMRASQCSVKLSRNAERRISFTAARRGISMTRGIHSLRYLPSSTRWLSCGSWGVEPSVVLGHSVGEYAAACVAGLYTPAEGMALIRERARLMAELPYGEGAMAAIFATEQAVQQEIAGSSRWISIAALNGPENVVISGRAVEVESICQRFSGKGIRVERLRVSTRSTRR